MAMNSTFRAMTKAGFNRANFPRLQEVLFITESEAAALYVARYYRDEKGQEFLKVHLMQRLVMFLLIVRDRRTNILCSLMLEGVRW